MSNIIEQTNQLQQQVANISSLNPQLTYSFIMRDSFYALVPTEFKQYYMNNVRSCAGWYSGFVPEFHNAKNGIFSTRIGNAIIKEVSKLIVGGNVFFGNKYKEKNPKNVVNENLIKWNKYADYVDIQSFIKKLVEYTAALGTSVIKLDINESRDLIPSVWRLDQCFYTTDYTGNATSFTGFLKSYTANVNNGDGRTPTFNSFYLLEKRYYNENANPVKKIFIKKRDSAVISSQSFDTAETSEVKWEQLPKKVKEWLKADFGKDFRLDVEIPISPLLPNLGILVCKYTAANTIPEIDMGESALLNVIGYLIGYEQAYAEMITDLYLGRGKVLLPQQMVNPTDVNNLYYSDLDGMLFTKFPYLSDKDQKPISIQFELRAEEWVKTRNNLVENIASQIGVAGSDIFSFLKDASGGSKTATQIAAEAQKTISYIEEKRSLFTSKLNQFIKIWKDFYKIDDDFTIKFSSQNHVNMLVTTEQTRVMNEVGFAKFDIFKKMFPDLDDEQVKEMVDRKFEEERRKLDMQAEVNEKAFKNSLKIGDMGSNDKGEDDEKEEIDNMSDKTEAHKDNKLK